MDKSWRPFKIEAADELKKKLKKTKLSNPHVTCLKMLVNGPVGSGKSSYINCIDSIFQGRMTSPATVETASDISFTGKFKIYKIKDGQYGSFLPFELCDVMGLERGEKQGARTDDIVHIIQGHMKDGYKFEAASSVIQQGGKHYEAMPTLDDKVHCLVTIVDANKVALLDESIMQKMKTVRRECSMTTEGIPQVVVMTHVDEVCPHVRDNLEDVYRSRKIKEKLEQCSNRLGVAKNLIYPLKNYHEEIELNSVIDTLALHSLDRIFNLGNDYLANLKSIAEADQFDREWKRIRWEPSLYVSELKDVYTPTSGVDHLRLLLWGPRSAGKSSFINSLHSAIKQRFTMPALGYTTQYKSYKFWDEGKEQLPFVMADTMGLAGGTNVGAHVDDITNALKGHIEDGHEFNPVHPLKKDSPNYISNPSLASQAHCLMLVIRADEDIEPDLLTKIKTIIEKAKDIPQVIVMTMVDRALPCLDLKNIYTRKTLKSKIEEWSKMLGVPLRYIFPVKNYHDETELDEHVNALLLSALKDTLTCAHDYVKSKNQ